MGKSAKSMYQHLSEKRVKNMEVAQQGVLMLYCSHYDHSPRFRYYSAKRKESENVCDCLGRRNDYARAAQFHYEKGGEKSEDYVEHFLTDCDDDKLMDVIYPQRIWDLHRVEQIISYQLIRVSARRNGIERAAVI